MDRFQLMAPKKFLLNLPVLKIVNGLYMIILYYESDSTGSTQSHLHINVMLMSY